VPEGEAFTATAKVRAADSYAVGGRVRFSAPGWEETVYADGGTASVTVPAQTGAGPRTITAQFLGHEVLTASQAAESILVTPVVSVPIGGTVPSTLALSLGGPATLGSFVPGVDREYTAATTATVTSTMQEATLSVSSATLANGAFRLAQPVSVAPAKTAWTGPVSNDTFAVAFRQFVGRTEPLRTGHYSASVTFTLSSTQP
jgi:hypothetical protein